MLKLTRPHQVEHPHGMRGLVREVAALQGNHHPALPRLYRDGSTAQVPHIALEYVDGPALDEELPADGPLDAPEVALFGAQLLSGLRALHRRGIAHVDLKPGSVVLRDMRPVLIGFGSARRIGARQPPGYLIGTPGYAAPELEAGEPITTAMDLYSLGAILHEALLGKPTFDPGIAACERPMPQPVGDTRTGELVFALLDPDPDKRPLAGEALTTFASALPADLRPWPAWADLSA